MTHKNLLVAALFWIVLQTGASEAVTVSVSDVSVDPGQAGMAVSVEVDDAKGIAGGNFTLTYPSGVLTAKQARGTDLVTGAGITVVPNVSTAGQVKVSMAGATGIASGKGALVTITFDVKSDAAGGTYDLTLDASLKDENGKAIPATTKKGVLTVVRKSSVYGLSVKVEPALPNTQDPVKVTVSAEVPNPGYTLSIRHSITGNKISISGNVVPPPPGTFWIQIIGIASASVTLGKLPEGTYEVEAFIGGVTSKATFSVRAIGIQVFPADVTATIGSSVTIPISVDDAKGIAGGNFTLTYPSGVLTAKQARGTDLVTSAGITVVPNLNTAGQVKVSMAGATGIASGKGALVTITFDVKPDAAGGTYDLTLDASLKDENGKTLPVAVKKGILTVVQPPAKNRSDFDGDGEVGFNDFFLFAGGFGNKATGENAKFDLDGDGEVGFGDFFLFAGDFGKKGG